MAVIGKIGLTPKGEYNPEIVYEILDVVSNEGNSYVSRQANNTQPLTNSEAWMLSAEKGGKGDQGNTFTFDDLTPAQKEELKGDVIAYNSLTEVDKNDLASRVPVNGVVEEGNTQAVSGDEVFRQGYLKGLDLTKSTLNISVLNNKFDYANLSEAVLSLSSDFRKKGLSVSYSDGNGSWHDYQYIGADDASDFNFTQIANWRRLSVITNIWQPNAQLTHPGKSVNIGSNVKIKNVYTATNFSPYTENGLKQYFISMIGRIGTAPNQFYRIGVSQKIGSAVTSVGVVQVPTAEVLESPNVSSFPITVANNEIKFEFLVDFSGGGLDDNFFQLNYDLTGLNDGIILSAKKEVQNSAIKNLSAEVHNASWDKFVYRDLTDGYVVEFDIAPNTRGNLGKFGINVLGIVDPNFASANKSISVASFRERLVIARVDTGQTKSVLHADLDRFKLIVNNNLVYLFVNGVLVDSYVYEELRSSLVIFEPSAYKSVNNLKVTSKKANYLNYDVFGKDAVFNKIEVNKALKARGIIDVNYTDVKNFTKTEIESKGIELIGGTVGTSNAVYKIPIKIAPKFRLKVEFKPNFDINTGAVDYKQIIDTMALFDAWNVGYDKMFKAYLKTGLPTAKTITANGVTIRTTIPNYISGTRVEFGTKGYNNNYVEHNLDGYVNKPMAGDDSFYIRFKGDFTNVENQKLYLKNDGFNLQILKDGDEANPIASFFLADYASVQDLYNAIKASTDLTDFEFNFRNIAAHPTSELLEFDKIYFCQNIPNGNKSTGGGFAGGIHWDSFPIYLPLKDSAWHTLEIFIDNERSRDKMRATLDGIVKNMVYRDGAVSADEIEGYMILGGDKDGNPANCYFRNLVIEPYNTETFTPKVVVGIAHHITDTQDGTIDPIQGAYYSSIGSMVRFMDTAFKYGWKPITMRQLEGFLYHNEPIPLKSFIMTFDDSIMELLTNVRLRQAFISRGVKPVIPMISYGLRPLSEKENKLVTAAYNNDWGMMLHDTTHDMYMGCYRYDDLGTHILDGIDMMLENWGIMSDWQANNFGWGTPMSSKVMRDNGLNIAFGTFAMSDSMILGYGSNPMYLNRLTIQGDSNFNLIEDVLKYI